MTKNELVKLETCNLKDLISLLQKKHKLSGTDASKIITTAHTYGVEFALKASELNNDI